MITGKNYIGYSLSSEGKITFRTFNPKLNIENETDFYEADKNEIEKAVMLAARAFEIYRKKSGKEKAAFLNAIADEILELGDQLITTYCSESGLPEARAIGERGRTTGQLRSFAQLLEEGSWVEATIDTAMPDRNPLPRPDLRKMLVPIGPVAVFGASNFPLAFSTAGGDTASALAAGCPVIVKSHPMHAGTGELISSAIVKAAIKTAMPEGVFSNLNSKGIEVGVKLVEHPEIKGVGFTGSYRGGKALMQLGSERKEPIPVFTEMGSINPVVLFPEALRERKDQLAKMIAGSITLGTGQFCTNPGLILGIAGPELDDFKDGLSREILEIQPAHMLHPAIAEAYENGRNKFVTESMITASTEVKLDANMARQTVASVSGRTFLKNPELHQEVFGPFSLLVECRDEAELEKVISGIEGQLTGTLIATEREITKYTKVTDALQQKVGRILFNGVPTGVEVCAAMHHGGPYPATSDARFTSVGTDSIKRWVRPMCFQDLPETLLPQELHDSNPLKIYRTINNRITNDDIRQIS